jgi:hypothetical protein
MTNRRIGQKLETPFVACVAAHRWKIARTTKADVKPMSGSARLIAKLANDGTA